MSEEDLIVTTKRAFGRCAVAASRRAGRLRSGVDRRRRGARQRAGHPQRSDEPQAAHHHQPVRREPRLRRPQRRRARHAARRQGRSARTPGAQFTKYLTIYRKIIVSLS